MFIEKKGLKFDPDTADWEKASGPNSDNCAEVTLLEGGAAIRDSRNPDDGIQVYDAGEWAALRQAFIDGKF